MCIAPFSLGLRNLHFNIDIPVELSARPASRPKVSQSVPASCYGSAYKNTHDFCNGIVCNRAIDQRSDTSLADHFFSPSFLFESFPLPPRFDFQISTLCTSYLARSTKYSFGLAFTIRSGTHKFIHYVYRSTQFTAGYVVDS